MIFVGLGFDVDDLVLTMECHTRFVHAVYYFTAFNTLFRVVVEIQRCICRTYILPTVYRSQTNSLSRKRG